MTKKSKKSTRPFFGGFTFLEILIVVGILIIIAAAVIVTVDPIQRFKAARDDSREAHIRQIWEAVTKKLTLEGKWQCGEEGPLPFKLDGENKPIFQYIGTGAGNYDLFSCLVPDYLAEVLLDPTEGSEANSGYQIWQHPVTKRFSVYAPYAETRDIWIGAEPGEALAVPVDFLHGWAFSENIGWISMNVLTGGGEEDYGVGVGENGNLTGTAWNRGTEFDVGGLGWLEFDAQPFTGENFPAEPLHSAKYDSGTGKITGWVRFCSGTANNDCQSASREDFDGWVLLGPIVIGDTDYGVEVDTSVYPAELYGWAYGSEPVGWISFHCNNPELTEPRCQDSDYKVFMEKTHP